MEKNSNIEKMEIEKINIPKESHINNINQHLEEEIESHHQEKSEFQKQNRQIETTKSELNCSISTNNSNSNISTDKIKDLDDSNNKKDNKKEDLSTIFKIDKIVKQKKTFNYLYSEEYLEEIYTNLILDEKYSKLKIRNNYMKQQNDINEEMRAILVDWIIEVHNRFHFKRKTLFQTILIIDLYLSLRVIQKSRFQLLGIACLLISVKENEIFNPRLEEFVNITDNAYTKTELLNMEIHVLQTLNFDILFPTSEEFYDILSKFFNFNRVQHHLGEYFIDSSLVEYNMLKYNASIIAIACAYIVMKFYNIKGYKDLYSCKINGNSSKKIIKECARDLCYLVKKLSKSSLRSTKDKYSSEEYDEVAILCEEE